MRLLRKYNIEWFPVLLFLMAFVLWRGAYYQVSLYIMIPLLVTYSFIRYFRKISHSRFWIPYLFMLLWVFLSSLINPYSEDSLIVMIPMLAAFLLAFSVYAIALRYDNSIFLYFAYFVFFIVLLTQNYQYSGGFTQDFNYANEIERRNAMKMDANEYAYYSFFLIISVRMILEGLGKAKYKAILLLMYFALIVVSVYVALFTASRQVLYMNTPLLAYLVYLDFIKREKKKGRKALLFIIIIGILFAIMPIFFYYFNNSFLAVRSEVSYEEDGRSSLLLDAMEIAFRHPLFGVGLGHPERTTINGIPFYFSHCTYTHLASRCGLIAMFLYLFIVLKYIITQYKHYRLTKDTTFLLYFIFGFFYFIGNFLYNYSDGPFMMSILFILIGDSERYYSHKTQFYGAH